MAPNDLLTTATICSQKVPSRGFWLAAIHAGRRPTVATHFEIAVSGVYVNIVVFRIGHKTLQNGVVGKVRNKRPKRYN